MDERVFREGKEVVAGGKCAIKENWEKGRKRSRLKRTSPGTSSQLRLHSWVTGGNSSGGESGRVSDYCWRDE